MHVDSKMMRGFLWVNPINGLRVRGTISGMNPNADGNTSLPLHCLDLRVSIYRPQSQAQSSRPTTGNPKSPTPKPSTPSRRIRQPSHAHPVVPCRRSWGCQGHGAFLLGFGFGEGGGGRLGCQETSHGFKLTQIEAARFKIRASGRIGAWVPTIQLSVKHPVCFTGLRCGLGHVHALRVRAITSLLH